MFNGVVLSLIVLFYIQFCCSLFRRVVLCLCCSMFSFVVLCLCCCTLNYVVLCLIVLFYVLFVSIVLFYVLLVCKCVLYYCHRVTTQLQLTDISYTKYQIILNSRFNE